MGSAAAEDAVEFGFERNGSGGIFCQQIKRPGQSERCSVQSGRHQGDEFIAQLFVAHGASILVAGLEQHGQEVAGIAVAGAAFADQAVNERVETAHDVLVVTRAGRRNKVEQEAVPFPLGGEAFHDHGGGFIQAINFRRDGRIKKRFGDDLRGQVHHVGMDLAGFTRLPGGEHLAGKIDDDVGVGGDAIAMKSGLGEAALADPMLTLARQQALAKETAHDGRTVADGFAEIAGLCNKDGLDVPRVVENDGGAVEETDGHEIAVVAGATFEESERIAAEILEAAEKEGTFGAGRKGLGCHGHGRYLTRFGVVCE